MDIDSDHLLRSPFTVGAIGALIAARNIPGASLVEKIINCACGTAIAGFMTPAFTEWLSMKSQAYMNGAAFMFGLVGMSLAAAILQGIKDTPLSQIMTGWLSRKG